MRPVAHAAHQSVLDRIEMDVVGVALDRDARGDKPMREMRLDPFSAGGEIGIARRQSPEGVQVVRQDRDGVDREGTFVPRDAEGGAQGGDAMHQRRGCPVSERDPRDEVAPVSDHPERLSLIARGCHRESRAPKALQDWSRISLRSIRATS
jgi:hypothetical protein